ncbi:MAG: DUF721 domain-containing protein [Armatimonadota bacterium]
MNRFESVGGWLWEVLRQLGIEREFRARRALSAWETLTGEAIARVAQPLRLEGGTLWVAVKSSAWAQELQFQKATLLERLNHEAGSDCFREIRFVVRAQLPNPSAVVSAHREGAFLPRHVELEKEEQEAIRQTVEAIQEPALREAVRRAREASLRYEKWRLLNGWRRCERCGGWHTESARFCFLCREQG